MDPKLVAIIEDYARTHGLNLPPHQIVSDMVASGPSGVEQLLALLGVTINAGDPLDNSQAEGGYTKRETGLSGAMTQFPANEESSAAQMAGVGGKDPMSELSSLTQAATGTGQSLSGLLQPFTQFGQQIPQQGMQAMQAAMGAFQHGAGTGAGAAGGIPGELAGAGGRLGGDAAELAGAAGGAGGGLAGTAPAAQLGPPPTPSASTVPASSATSPPVPAAPPDSAGGARGGMAGMPMVPPGAMAGASGSGSDSKPDTKRVVAPSVKNGAPVQGRIVAPPTTLEVVKRVAGKPVASRRILSPEQNPDDEDPGLPT
ncbi:hypothetical protein [Candidatus Mycobacterium methanotrophicum]|uniref:Uncharacterized protein n=1 Tax=Candidatus Mycobacterium methanotrophicum TaxID=2943498 RepID=A0ABY4QJS4_9MYCO|nr:hypothetical protein [Candidatus Mycobacterium methanotrophicum]UQX10789.1 hypothetical protein M5I08_22935 [Candidatus Mycobacterium methanotrophicum]